MHFVSKWNPSWLPTDPFRHRPAIVANWVFDTAFGFRLPISGKSHSKGESTGPLGDSSMDTKASSCFISEMEKIDWIEKVKAFRASGSFENTMQYLLEVMKDNPSDPVVHYQVAWTHDALGRESDAAPAYEKAMALGLSGNDLEGAYLGLGSTYRCLGDYENSKRILEKGISRFPENGALKAFLAMTLFNLRDHEQAMELLIKELTKSSNDPAIQTYRRALMNYSDKLNETFD